MADETLAFDLLVRDRNASRTLKGVGDAATKTGRDFDKASDGAGHLSAQIDETTLRLKELGEEFDRTGDRGLLKDIGKERRTLAGLTKLRKEMGGLADETARVGRAGLSGLTDTIEALPQQLRGGLIVGAGVAATAAAPFVGAAIAGAIGGALGSGAIAAGIAGAARSSQVKSAWTALASEAETALSTFSNPFIQPTVKALGVFRSALVDVRDDLAAMGEDAAGFVEPLARGFAGLVQQAMPGLRSMMRDVRPVFDMLGDELPDLGNAIGSFFESIGDGSEGGAQALRDLLELTEKGTVATGEALEFLGKHYQEFKRVAIDASGPIGDLVPLLMQLAPEEHEKLVKGRSKIAEALDAISDAARDAADRIGELNDRFNDLFDKQMNLDQANVDFKLGLIELGDTLKDNNETIDDANERWLANQDALLGMIREADGVKDAAIDMGNGTEEASRVANAAYNAQLDQIRKVALALQLPIDKVNELIDRYNAARFLPNIVKTVTFVAEGMVPGGPRGTIIGFSHGGPVHGPGPKGVDSVPAMLAPGEFVVNSRAAARIGMDALSRINRDAGMVAPSASPSMGGGGGGPIELRVSWAGPGGPTGDIGAALLRFLRYEVRDKGGNVQQVLGR